MCGISGVYAVHINERHKKINAAIINDQFRRGPDYQASIVVKSHSSQVLLGHNRLKIIDLSEHGNQPMWDSTGRFCIVYNGEVYNYIELKKELQQTGLTFHSQTDTEVILNAFLHWGIESLSRLQGPFAFALFDKEKEELWLCRDRFGVRPLYYFTTNNELYFASTTQILAKEFNLPPNLAYVTQGLNYLVYEDGSNHSPHQQLVSLPAGSYLQCKFNASTTLTTHTHLYYDLEKNVAGLKDTLLTHNADALLEMISSSLDRSVQIRLRTDVPLGISLSSGLDSSSVASLVAKKYSNVIGFSVGHPDVKKSEGPLVAKCANYLNMQIEYISPTPSEMMEALDQTIDAQGAPFSSFSVVAQYLLYKKVRAAGVKVLLGGQGGDEVFMGYKKFLFFQLKQLIKNKRYLTTLKQVMSLMPMLMAEVATLSSYWQHRHRYLHPHRKMATALNLPDSSPLHLTNTEQALWIRQLQDIKQFSLPTLLRYEDRNAMGNSVESRLPFLDHQLVEIGLAIPEALKLHAGYGKWAIRKIMQDKIPNQIRLARYKRGFDIPITTLLQAGMGQTIRESLQNNINKTKHFLKDRTSIEQWFSDQQLLHRPRALTEAITLLWLNKVTA